MSVQVGFIGVGGIARTHLETIAAAENAEVTTVYDVDEEAMHRAAEQWSATPADDLADLASHPDLDAAFVCIPPDAHGPAERAVAENDLALFVEKPVAIRTETAIDILEAIDEAGILAQVGHHWRYAPGIGHGRALLAERTIGYLDGRWWGGVPGGPNHWWREEERSGGQIIEQAIHVFDAIRYLAGEVETVCAAGGNRLVDGIDFPDVSSATMKHANGTVSHVSATSAAVESRIGIEAVASDATLSISESQVVGTVDGDPVDSRYSEDAYEREVEAFIEAVATNDDAPIRSSYADAVRSLAVTEATSESMRREEPVAVSDVLPDDQVSNRYSVPVSEDS